MKKKERNGSVIKKEDEGGEVIVDDVDVAEVLNKYISVYIGKIRKHLWAKPNIYAVVEMISTPTVC